jgi:HK97 family phage major capsid protein/HK97 family phage prohead protease
MNLSPITASARYFVGRNCRVGHTVGRVTLTRAWSLLSIKSFDDDARTIEGIATTPTPDRVGDIMEPHGAQFVLPLPLLWQHDQKQPIGQVIFAAVAPDGIAIKAQIARVDEPGALQTRLDDAWQTLRAGLVRGLSIGWKPIEIKRLKSGGTHAVKWLWAELSAVTIPQNVEATIFNVKALDLAASGRHPSHVRGPLPIVRAEKSAPRMDKKTIGERITEYENTRAAKVAALEAIQQKATDDNRTKSDTERDSFDTLKAEIQAVDAELADLHDMEHMVITKATPITASNPLEASAQRGAVPVVSVKANVPAGTGFIRYCQSLAVAKGNIMQAVEYAKQWHDSTPEVELVLKAAVAAGTTTDATWAGPLAPIKPLTDEFIAFLRPATILGRIPGLVKVPFNVSVAAQTGGGTYQWVGQNAPKPVGKLAFATVTLGITKAAGIIVITEELARTSTPSAEEVIRRDMVAGIAAFLDTEFIDPTKAAVAGVSPGSVTNGVTPITTAGTSPANARTDIQALANAMTALNISTNGAVLVLSETNALALTNALNPLGQPLFPSLAQQGGTIMGYTAVASQAAGTTVALIQPNSVLYADDGGVTIDVSREASLQMDTALDNPPLATTLLTSLWQMNLVGLRAERFINWKKARTGVVQYTVATYAA